MKSNQVTDTSLNASLLVFSMVLFLLPACSYDLCTDEFRPDMRIRGSKLVLHCLHLDTERRVTSDDLGKRFVKYKQQTEKYITYRSNRQKEREGRGTAKHVLRQCRHKPSRACTMSIDRSGIHFTVNKGDGRTG